MRSPYRTFSNDALTLVEVLVILIVVIGLVILMMPSLGNKERRSKRTQCISNLKQVALSAVTWAEENQRRFPWQQTTNGSYGQTNVVAHFLSLLNELVTPQVLLCPIEQQQGRHRADDFIKVKNENISYFLVLDSENGSGSILFGDHDITGLSSSTLCKVSGIAAPALEKGKTRWTEKRHKSGGNVAFADGSVQSINSTSLWEIMSRSSSTCGMSHVLKP